MVSALYIAALAVIAVSCLLGVLHPSYQDTLLQRLGMAVACLGAVAEIAVHLAGLDRLNASTVTAGGIAAFAVGTIVKKLRPRRAPKRHLEG